MKTGKLLLVVLAGLIPIIGTAGPVKFRIEVQPIGGVASPNAYLHLTKTVGFTTQTYELDGAGAYFGSLEVGVEIDTKIGFVDCLVGSGLLFMPVTAEGVEKSPGSGAFTTEVGYRFKLNRSGSVALGPFLGVVIPGDTTLELEDDTGAGNDTDTFDFYGEGGGMAGVRFTAGGKHVSFAMKVGYMSWGYEVEPGDDQSWTVSYGGDDRLDMSGFFAQFGISSQF